MNARLRRPLSTRFVAVVALLLLVAGGGAAAFAVGSTQAAWTDKTFVSAPITAGKWNAPTSIGCVAMNANGTPLAGGTCTVTSVSYNEWGSAGDRVRGYSVALNSNAGSGYIQFTIDLSGGQFTWTNAGITSSDQVTPTNGWTCAQLPKLTAKTPTNWGWGANSSIYFQVVENKTANPNVKCS